ncbi:platelet endothelial cell adhesion molecule isoform X2 [Notolabrus celidotus]|uniref:platelet endothelial cell adhesion molecule isoform X2 n=1 Tax=Notolabrus celidotus TaxID=1203425 RepID=UPI00149011D9|nr:platelet endothelial cell adhesion molecule isoform X2 [Notolabrus celidotus]
MGLLLLLTSSLLSSYFQTGRVVNAQRLFTIREITLSIEPSPDVTRDTNVTLRCHAMVSSSGQEPLSREYTISKDGNTVYTKTSSSSEDLLYPLPQARVSNSGKYKCQINIEGKQLTSSAKKLTVTGLSQPILRLKNGVVNEGEEIKATCEAPGETGSLFFFFYEGSKEITEMQVSSAQAEAKFRLSSAGFHKIHCDYTVLVTPDSFKSERSNTVTVSVKELSITPVLEIFPLYKIYEGDLLTISCTITDSRYNHDTFHLYLSQGTNLLSNGDSKVNHSMIALAKDPGEFECRLEMGIVVKVDTKTVTVTELFSVPTLTMSPAEVFQKEYMTLTCRSEMFASERLSKEELTYTLDPPDSHLIQKGTGVFSGRTLSNDFNYTCKAQAKGIVKHSKTLTVRPKVSVSTPRISVVGRAVVDQSIKILCQSDAGSLPINYTLLRDFTELSTVSVKLPFQQAVFTVRISSPAEISKFMCEAKNSQREAPLSKRLNATVIVPLTHPTLTVIPNVAEISEGDHLFLICGVDGTPPVTFKWYQVGNELPLYTTTANLNHSNYQVPLLSKEHSGTYHCEAINYANNVVRSDPVVIEVRMALWKKVLIGGFCLLAGVVLVVVLVLCFKSKRGKREAASELSVKPSSPKSDDSLTVNLTHDTEVYNADTVKVDKAEVSVWSRRPPESDAGDDEESSVETNEPDVEYTEVVHPQPVDPDRAPLRKGTDTVYSELQNSPHGAADHHDYGSVEYAELNSEQPEINHYSTDVNNYHDLPEPVD